MTPLARLEILHFRHELPTPVPTVMGPLTHRPALLLRLEDSDGAVGWGEIWCNFPPDGDLHRARLAAGVARTALTGIDRAERPFDHVVARLHRLVLQAGEPGPVAQIASGLDIALTDLAARQRGETLAAYLGGAVRDLPAYASGISPEMAGDQIDAMRRLGYRTFKQRIGFGVDDGLSEAENTASGLTPDERLMLDANQAWDVSRATEQARRLSRLNLVWLEEPMPADAPEADWIALAGATEIPLAAGENMTGHSAFRDMMKCGALSYLQPDICKWGGLTATAAIARAAEAEGLTYCPHFLGGGIGLLASAHLLAAVGGRGLLEVDASENPLLAHFSGGLELTSGRFALPAGHGFGPEPDIAGVQELAVSRTEVML